MDTIDSILRQVETWRDAAGGLTWAASDIHHVATNAAWDLERAQYLPLRAVRQLIDEWESCLGTAETGSERDVINATIDALCAIVASRRRRRRRSAATTG